MVLDSEVLATDQDSLSADIPLSEPPPSDMDPGWALDMDSEVPPLWATESEEAMVSEAATELESLPLSSEEVTALPQ